MSRQFYSGNEYDVRKFAELLYNARTKLGCNIKDFAEFIGISISNYQNYEKSRVTKISTDLIDKLCDKLNTKPDYWLQPLNANALPPKIYKWLETDEAIPYLLKAYKQYELDKTNQKNNKLAQKALEFGKETEQENN